MDEKEITSMAVQQVQEVLKNNLGNRLTEELATGIIMRCETLIYDGIRNGNAKPIKLGQPIQAGEESQEQKQDPTKFDDLSSILLNEDQEESQ